MNDWSEFEKKRGLERSGRAADQYHRYESDFSLASSLGHNAHRFSIEWSRIEPEQGEWNEDEIRHYQNVVEALRKRNLEPFVTLWHWTLPLWFRDRGGWLAPDAENFFGRFAEKMALSLLDVRRWITVNEPTVYAANGFLRGRWPPGKRDLFAYFRASKNLARAHCAAYRRIKRLMPSAEVGIAQNITYFDPAGGNFSDRALAWVADRFGNWDFLDRIRGMQDYVGVNYYFHNRVKRGYNRNENGSVSDLGWEIYPRGLTPVLEETWKRYGKPIYILENGVADAKDGLRAEFIRSHIDAMRAAMANGADVRGYFHWSLIDNFEWDKGFAPRFGLVAVDYQTMERTIRQSAFAYKEIISKNSDWSS